MKKRLSLLTTSFLILLLFVAFSREIKHGAWKQIDFDTTVHIQDKIWGRFDELWDDGAILVDPIVSSVLVLCLTIWAWKRFRFRSLLIPAAFFFLTATEMYGKTMLPHPGPPFFMVKHPTTIFPRFMVIEPYSYPSGHASRSTFLAFVLFGLVWPKLKRQSSKVLAGVLIVGYVLFVYIGRVYLGQHWLSDIFGGILLGASTGLLGTLFLL